MRFMDVVWEDMQMVGVSDWDVASRRNWRLQICCGDPQWEQLKERKRRLWEKQSCFLLPSQPMCLSHKVSGTLLFNLAKCCAVIIVCCILHNYACHLEVPEPAAADIEDILEEDSDNNGQPNNQLYERARAHLVANYFS